MSNHPTQQQRTRQPFKAPCWDAEAHTPIVDGKYEDPSTGEIKTASGPAYGGPPEVDLIILSIHEETAGCVYRSSRPFKMEHLLIHIVNVINDRDLEMDSLNATPYAIRLVLAHEISKDEFSAIFDEMSNGLWSPEEES